MDVAAQNAILDTLLGANRAASMPATFDLALFDDDPDIDGIELDATGGYARVPVANDGTRWPVAAADGMKTSTEVTLAGTATYQAAATYWALVTTAVGVDTVWFTGELADPVLEPTDTVTLTVFFGDSEG